LISIPVSFSPTPLQLLKGSTMKKSLKQSIIALTLGLGMSVSAFAQDIVDVAVKAGSFKTLVAAVQAAGLVDTLKSPGPFTVFAPTDEAFAKIPKETLDALLKDKAALAKILTYHVVSGKVMAKDVKPGMVKSVQGQDITLATAGGVTVNGAKVVAADVAASNGVIHAIDTVIMPK
jgi:uncharacterized surface protein with fasciclin (FAS1) repeats